MERAVGIQFALIDDLRRPRDHVSALSARDPFHRPFDFGIERCVLVLVVPFEMMNRDLHGDLPPMRDVGPSIARSMGSWDGEIRGSREGERFRPAVLSYSGLCGFSQRRYPRARD